MIGPAARRVRAPAHIGVPAGRESCVLVRTAASSHEPVVREDLMGTALERARRALAVTSLIVLLLPADEGQAEILLRDDFEGSALDATRWFVPTGPGTFFGRTQIRPPSVPLSVSGGVLRLQLDTWNPSALVSGDSFFGSEIDTIGIYGVGTGLSFSARVRLVAPIPGGLVGSLFSFVFLPAIPGHDEIDFELLSNDVASNEERVLSNVFDDDDFSQPGSPSFLAVPGLDLTAFNTYEVRWHPNRVEWYVNGVLHRTETGIVPLEPQNVRLNFWAPDAFFADAYDAALVPAAAESQNETFFYEVDWVQVERIEPPVPVLGRGGLAVLIGTLAAVLALSVSARRRGGASPA
jgi:hypothetical protein